MYKLTPPAQATDPRSIVFCDQSAYFEALDVSIRLQESLLALSKSETDFETVLEIVQDLHYDLKVIEKNLVYMLED
jgi:hypothetical protein